MLHSGSQSLAWILTRSVSLLCVSIQSMSALGEGTAAGSMKICESPDCRPKASNALGTLDGLCDDVIRMISEYLNCDELKAFTLTNKGLFRILILEQKKRKRAQGARFYLNALMHLKSLANLNQIFFKSRVELWRDPRLNLIIQSIHLDPHFKPPLKVDSSFEVLHYPCIYSKENCIQFNSFLRKVPKYPCLRLSIKDQPSLKRKGIRALLRLLEGAQLDLLLVDETALRVGEFLKWIELCESQMESIGTHTPLIVSILAAYGNANAFSEVLGVKAPNFNALLDAHLACFFTDRRWKLEPLIRVGFTQTQVMQASASAFKILNKVSYTVTQAAYEGLLLLLKPRRWYDKGYYFSQSGLNCCLGEKMTLMYRYGKDPCLSFEIIAHAEWTPSIG